MREGLFIKKNIEKWKGYQYETSADPDEMAQEFTELVNDLGYAKTFYPHSKVTLYLNGLASKIYLGIYKNKKEEKSRIFRFWKTELPLVVRKHHRELLYAFLLFTCFAVMAAFSTAQDQSFVRGILGDGYMEMTEQNIAKGDPFGVYKNAGQVQMFLSIALNNIKVAFMVFIGGLLVNIGAIWMLFDNGMMLGAFQTFFFIKGLGWESILVVWIHGTLEISAIIISGGAGFIMGNSILFPKTYNRLDSLKRGAKDGIKLMIGLTPVFIVAAFLEGFITRYSTMPKPVSITILAASLSFIIWYFIVYPIRLQNRLKRIKSINSLT
ncbi:MAG: stage II sporulation protein M [Flavitalea sp.]